MAASIWSRCRPGNTRARRRSAAARFAASRSPCAQAARWSTTSGRCAVRAKAILLFALLAATGSARGACLANAPSLSFGPYDGVSGSPATTSAAITVTCDQSPAATATISIGPSGVSGGFFPRRMRQDGGSDTLDYNFYADPGGASVWGDGTGGTVTRSQRVL